MKKSTEKKATFISVALIIILSFVVYGNSLGNKFLWDDNSLVSNNTYIKNWSHVPKIFTEDVGAGSGSKYSFYRPVQMLTYMADYSLYGLNVRGYHFTNILLHALAALSLYWFINILCDDRIVSLLAGLFFAAHPIHTEAVSYISGRSDSLAFLFMLLCFILYIKQSRSYNPKVYILMLLSYAFALLSRENSLILPVLVAVYHYVFKEKIDLKGFLGISCMAVIYVLLRTIILKSILLEMACSATFVQRIPAFFVAITNYIKLLLLPLDLHMEYGKGPFAFTDPRAILGVVIVFLSILYAFRKKKSDKPISFSIFWFFIAILPTSNLYVINAYMAEHWLYLPSVGFFIILAKALSVLYRSKTFKIVSIIIIVSLLGFYSYLTLKQNSYWKDPITFYEKTLKYAPRSTKALNNLGIAYNDIGKRDEAIALYKKVLEIDPNCGESYYNLANLYSFMGKKREAMALYEKALEIDPNYIEAYNNLGNLYDDLGNKEKAITLYKKVIMLNPNHAKAYFNLGSAYYQLGKKEEAIALYKKSISINPRYAMAYRNLSLAYYYAGQYDLSLKCYNKAKELGLVEPVLTNLLEKHEERN